VTNEQIRTIKATQRRLTLDDASYRLILRNIGGVESCKALTNESFEQVMAFFEETGANRTTPLQIGSTPTYWRDKAASAGGRMAYKIHALFAVYQELTCHLPEEQQYKLPGLCENFSGNAHRAPEQLDSRQQWMMIEGLKKIIARIEQAAADSFTPGRISGTPADTPF